MKLMRRSTHSQRLENWLGKEHTERISMAMRDFYWHIPIMGIPGGPVVAMPGGDFRGRLDVGSEVSGLEVVQDQLKRAAKARRFLAGHRRHQSGATFDSISTMIAAAGSGGLRRFPFNKTGPTGVVSVTSSLWKSGPIPPAAANAGAAPGGTAFTDATTGAFLFDNPSSGSQRILSANPIATVAGNTLLLYDRLFAVDKTMNSTATQAVTGVPTRYQSGTATAEDYIGGNFGMIEVGATALAATAHNWTVCTYTDQASAASTLPSSTGVSGAIIHRLDQPTATWFLALETGDVGIKAWTQMQCSALVATGEINFVIGHPIAWMPCPIANCLCSRNYVELMELFRIFDDAALAFLEIWKPATTATTYVGDFATLR